MDVLRSPQICYMQFKFKLTLVCEGSYHPFLLQTFTVSQICQGLTTCQGVMAVREGKQG